MSWIVNLQRLDSASYDAALGIRASSLSRILTEPMRYHEPVEATAAMRLGSLVHRLYLEPALDLTGFVPIDLASDKSKAWDKHAEECKAAGLAPCLTSETERAKEIAKKLAGHEKAAELLAGEHEGGWTWVDLHTGLRMRGKIDARSPGIVADLKVVRDASPARMRWTIKDYGYLPQMACYHDVAWNLEPVGSQSPAAWIVAVESEPPYPISCIEIGDDRLDTARLRIMAALAAAAKYEREGWPTDYGVFHLDTMQGE
ncbi:MAG: hypothetical protein FJX72_19735 [Armatimonadetes bacterium]|nr:hypothetical protein [Armatimonadota bacterium]